MSSNNTL